MEKPKIIVLNGSPKGDASITVHSINYLELKFPNVEFIYLNVAQKIKLLENQEHEWNKTISAIENAQAVLWTFPVYYLLVHSSYKRFIELLFQRNVKNKFKGIYAASFSTSIHFFDHLAHKYIRAVSEDLGMVFCGSFTADMEDLLVETNRLHLEDFFGLFVSDIQEKRQRTTTLYPARKIPDAHKKLSLFDISLDSQKIKSLKTNKRIVVIADSLNDSAVKAMITNFTSYFAMEIEVYDLSAINIAGPCLGCFACAIDHQCIYTGKDDYTKFYSQNIIAADILVLAGSIHDWYLSSKWKVFFDRTFFKTHSPTMHFKQIGLLVNGPYFQTPPLYLGMEGFYETQGADFVGVVSNECEDNTMFNHNMYSLACALIRRSELNYQAPLSYLGFGARKIARDHLWGRTMKYFQADHHIYKKMGLYDFPHKNISRNFMNRILYLIFKLPFIRRKFKEKSKEMPGAPHKKLLEKERKKLVPL